jgi:HAD superfamily hydrolase (TIGR01458 family)
MKAVFIDLSGVLYIGREAIPGAREAVSRLQSSGLAIRFVTNTSRMTRQQILDSLRALGFDIHDEQLVTAPAAAHDWVVSRGLRPYCLVHDNIRSEFADLDPSDPNVVVIGDAADGFTYAALNRAFELCLEGAPLVGIGRNRYFRLDGRFQLDAGPFITAIEFAADTEAVIVGKPSRAFFEQVLADVGCQPAEAIMIGDDVQGDVEGALKAGLQACLVKTGKYRPGDESRIPGRFMVADSIADAVGRLLG